MNRLLKESDLPAGKPLGTIDEKLLPPKIRRVLPTLLEEHFVDKAENIIAIGLPGCGKTHLLAALGRELILRHRIPVLFVPTFKLVQDLLAAKKALWLESERRRLDRFPVVILDEFGYVQQEREEMEVVFTFLAELRTPERSHQHQPGVLEVGSNFKDPMTTMRMAPLAREKSTANFITGKPHPFFWVEGCGYSTWFLAVSAN
jgi:DNA replication protein DnaC